MEGGEGGANEEWKYMEGEEERREEKIKIKGKRKAGKKGREEEVKNGRKWKTDGNETFSRLLLFVFLHHIPTLHHDFGEGEVGWMTGGERRQSGDPS